MVNRPRIRAPDEGEVRVVDAKPVILPRSMAHEPHSLVMNDRCKCVEVRGPFSPSFFHTAGRERSPKFPGFRTRRRADKSEVLGTHRAFQSGSRSREASFPQFSNFPTAGWPHGVQLSFRVYTRCESTTLVYISVSGYHPRKFRGC